MLIKVGSMEIQTKTQRETKEVKEKNFIHMICDQTISEHTLFTKIDRTGLLHIPLEYKINTE